MTWPRFDQGPDTDPPAAYFLDVDGTLLGATTSFLFAKLLRRRGFLGGGLLLRGLYHGFQHHFGRLDYGRLIEFAIQNFLSAPADLLEEVALENFQTQVRPRLYVGVEEHLAALRATGAPLVLVSSSPRLVLQPLADHLRCADILTTPVEIRDGRLVGLGEGPHCYGPGKLHWASQWARQHRIPLQRAAAYADNWSDLPLLENVGHPVVVNPRRKLRKLAHARNWTIVHPKKPKRTNTHPADPS